VGKHSSIGYGNFTPHSLQGKSARNLSVVSQAHKDRGHAYAAMSRKLAKVQYRLDSSLYNLAFKRSLLPIIISPKV
jgi:hypothetical protein